MPRKKSDARPPATRRKSAPAPTTIQADGDKADSAGPGLRHEVDGLVYELDAAPRRGGRGRNVVTVRHAGDSTGGGLIDRCDLYSHRARHRLAQLVAEQFGREVGQVMGHLALVLDAAERAAEVHDPGPVRVAPERRATAEELLADAGLLEGAAQAMAALGHVGEEQVKRLAYLVATSRILPRPLSALLLAPSGTGKSAVLEAVSALMPPEQVVSVARLTAHSLYYAGADALRQKLIVVDEYEGQAEADHAIRVLQSRGELTLTTTAKGKAEQFTVRGPVAVMSGTTLSNLDPQNISRCLELALDDSPEQTRRVQAAQTHAWAGANEGAQELEVWQDAQRLLAEHAPVLVVIPFAPKLAFPARTTADRRASAKILGLIAAHAALHLLQRDRDRRGRVVATIEDYAVVYSLLRPQVEAHVDGLSPRATALYRALLSRTRGPVSRREAAAHLGWSYMTTKRAFDELVGVEAVRVVPGLPRQYELIERGLHAQGAVLTPPEALAE